MKNNEIMQELIKAFPENLIEALKIAKRSPLKKSYPDFNNVLICGMGGSGIGGKIVASWIADEIKIPINFCQDYILPEYVDKKTLIIASSNSGDTEETLSATIQGHNLGATIVAICSGGKLAGFCSKWNYDCIVVPGDNPPRTALAFSIVQLIYIFVELNLIKKDKLVNLSTCKEFLDTFKEEIHEQAVQLAEFIDDKDLIIYCESKNEPIAIRARQQFNENSKILCNHHTIPEMNHNELVGWSGGSSKYAVVFLETNDWHPQNVKRRNFSIESINKKTKNIFILKAKGKTRIEQDLFLINLIDWASFYVAQMNETDSINIDVINNLKKLLSVQ